VNPNALDRVIRPLAKEIRRKPVETKFLVSRGGRRVGFVAGRDGRALDVRQSVARLATLHDRRRAGTDAGQRGVDLVIVAVPPELTAIEAAELAPRMVRLSGWTTHYPLGERNGFGANITIPARLINGTVVRPGQVFDFWKAVGPVTWARGFRMGGVIENGRTNPTGALGGGICSASTTMFNAAVRAGYEILERHPHYYYISRYPLGLDATVSKSGGRVSQNMRFRNDTDALLIIRGTAGPGWVRFEIYSTPPGRKVTFTKPRVWNVRRAVDRTQRTPILRRGTSRRLEVPTDGKDVLVIRTVRDASGQVVHRDRFVSHYARVDGLVLIGTGH
jgi:vancomycin resistance protein YoaR